MAGLNVCPYFACRDTMKGHIRHLANYCEPQGHCAHMHAPTHTDQCRTAQELEKVRLQWALPSSMHTGLMPSSSLCAKGGGGGRLTSQETSTRVGRW